MLRKMLVNERYLPPPLYLKLDNDHDLNSRKIEVRRLYSLRDRYASIEKRYVGAYEKRADEESDMLEATRSLNLVREHLADYGGKDHAGSSSNLVTSTYVRTRWRGLSIKSWQGLLKDEQSPFSNSVVAYLALVRAIVRALRAFHEAGFVHGDLLPQNIVIPARHNPQDGTWELELDKLRLIDLEFTLTPSEPLKVSNTNKIERRTDWFREKNGNVIWVHPIGHSLQLLPGAFTRNKVVRVDGDGKKYAVDEITKGALHADAKTHLSNANWSADLFSLAFWLLPMYKKGRFRDEEQYPNANAYVTNLLKKFNQLDADQVKGVPAPAPPHSEIVKEIDLLIGTREPEEQLKFKLPTRKELQLRDESNPLSREDDTVAADTAITRPVLKIIDGLPAFKAAKFLGGAALASVLAFWLAPTANQWWPEVKLIAGAAITAVTTETKPGPPPTPTAAERLATAEVALVGATPGSKDWQIALASAVELAKQPDLSAAQRNRFWSAVQERYLQQTKPVTNDFWWRKSEPDKGQPSAQDLAWLATSRALAEQGSWIAATYQARAIASRRGGLQTDAMQVTTARANLAQWATSPDFGPFPALGAAKQLEFQLEIAQLLTDIALVEAHFAKRAKLPIPEAPTAQLMPLLQSLSALPSPHGQMLLGVAASCLKQPADARLAQAEFTKAARAGAGADSKAIAADAKAWLEGKKACL
jgi:serine/threonine protein kinase